MNTRSTKITTPAKIKTPAKNKTPATMKEEAKKAEGDTITNLLMSMKKELNENIKEVKDCLSRDLHDLKSQNENITANIENSLKKIEKLTNENTELKETVTKLENRLSEMSSVMKKYEDKVAQIELYSRKNNLIFYGIRQDNEENCEAKIKSFFKEKMNLETEDMKFENCHRTPGRKPQPLIVRFNWHKDRMRVWNARFQLRETNISISEDLPSIFVERRRTLYPIMIHARKLNRHAYLKQDKLIIDNRTYSVHNLQNLPPELDPANLATATHGDVFAFFGGSSPLSNFYQCNLKIDNQKYISVEQYFQMEKSIFAENQEATKKIREASSSGACKKIGDSVTIANDDDWMAKAKNVMFKGMKAKFEQNERAKSFLLQTGNKFLAEATLNKIWGSGLKLNDAKHSEREFPGRNITGEILMSVRDTMV